MSSKAHSYGEAVMYPQVRERMRTSKETLQKLTPLAAAAVEAGAGAGSQPANGPDDDDCIICLDQPASVTFHPCSHCVTCPACAKLVAQRNQPCPLCRSPLSSIQTWRAVAN